MKPRSSMYLMFEVIIAVAFVASVFVSDWFYQAGVLAKGPALGLTAFLWLATAVAVVGFFIDLLVFGFRMKSPEKANG